MGREHLFLIASDRGSIIVFDIVTKSNLTKYRVHDKRNVQVNYNSKYRILVTSSFDIKIKVSQVLFGEYDHCVALGVIISHSLNNELSSIQLVEVRRPPQLVYNRTVLNYLATSRNS